MAAVSALCRGCSAASRALLLLVSPLGVAVPAAAAWLAGLGKQAWLSGYNPTG